LEREADLESVLLKLRERRATHCTRDAGARSAGKPSHMRGRDAAGLPPHEERHFRDASFASKACERGRLDPSQRCQDRRSRRLGRELRVRDCSGPDLVLLCPFPSGCSRRRAAAASHSRCGLSFSLLGCGREDEIRCRVGDDRGRRCDGLRGARRRGRSRGRPRNRWPRRPRARISVAGDGLRRGSIRERESENRDRQSCRAPDDR
jgi:hypothetical protein